MASLIKRPVPPWRPSQSPSVFFIARGILGISVLAPKAASNFGNSSTAVYAALAAGFALLATPLLHVLLLGASRLLAFFIWITALADLAAAAALNRAGYPPPIGSAVRARHARRRAARSVSTRPPRMPCPRWTSAASRTPGIQRVPGPA
jgi:hypothetical protein